MSSPIDQPAYGAGPAYPAGGYPQNNYPQGGYPQDSYPPGPAGAFPQPTYQPAGGPGSHAVQPPEPPQERSLGELVGNITADLSTLMQQEVALAKAEATQSAKRAGKGVGMFAGAGIAGYFVLLFLSVFLWWALGVHIGHGWSAFIVAILWAVVAAVLALRGRRELAQVRGLDRTTESLGKIPNAITGHEEQNR
jgi:hypothetical protein